MSEWKVFVDTIEIFPHPNANNMELGRVGSFQVVVGKGLYETGDIVAFAPKRSILPEDLRPYYTNEATGHSYLRGPNEDRVGSIRLRGEESEGVILPMTWWTKKYPNKKSPDFGEDISKELDITEYIPGKSGTPGAQRSVDQTLIQNVSDAVRMRRFTRHDVEQYGIFKNEFVLGEPVVVTEKLHGSQISAMKDVDGSIAITSKGRAEKNYVLREFPRKNYWKGNSFLNKVGNFFSTLFARRSTERNQYWNIAYDSGLIRFLRTPRFEGQEVQVIGEVIPFQKGYTYGQKVPAVRVFRLIIGTIEEPYNSFGIETTHWADGEIAWVPLLYSGPFDPDVIIPLAKGNETVSGKEEHIREGIVIAPAVARRSRNGVQLIVKVLNPKYKSNDEDLS